MNRADEPGWVKIGATCSAGRRSMWLRVNVNPERHDDVYSIELCAGREGDDNYVKIDNDESRQFYELWDLLMTAKFAAET